MKRLGIFFLLLTVIVAMAGDPEKQGGFSDLLSLWIRFEPASLKHDPQFFITLKNISGRDLSVPVC